MHVVIDFGSCLPVSFFIALCPDPRLFLKTFLCYDGSLTVFVRAVPLPWGGTVQLAWLYGARWRIADVRISVDSDDVVSAFAKLILKTLLYPDGSLTVVVRAVHAPRGGTAQLA